METIYLMSTAILSALNSRKKFVISLTYLFELPDFEDGATGKSQKIKFSKIQNF